MALGGWRTRSMFARYAITDSSDLLEAQAKLNAAFVATPRTVLPLRRAVGAPWGHGAPSRSTVPQKGE